MTGRADSRWLEKAADGEPGAVTVLGRLGVLRQPAPPLPDDDDDEGDSKADGIRSPEALRRNDDGGDSDGELAPEELEVAVVGSGSGELGGRSNSSCSECKGAAGAAACGGGSVPGSDTGMRGGGGVSCWLASRDESCACSCMRTVRRARSCESAFLVAVWRDLDEAQAASTCAARGPDAKSYASSSASSVPFSHDGSSPPDSMFDLLILRKTRSGWHSLTPTTSFEIWRPRAAAAAAAVVVQCPVRKGKRASVGDPRTATYQLSNVVVNGLAPRLQRLGEGRALAALEAGDGAVARERSLCGHLG